MSTLWVTSDSHFGHAKRMPQERCFDSIKEHDETIIQRWNNAVRKDDIVIHFGDVGVGSDEYTLECVSRLNGVRHLITGNHDSPWPGHQQAHRHQATWMRYFESVQAYGTRKVGKKRIMMAHLPYTGDHTAIPRYPEFRLPDTGALLLHGHVHDKWKVQDNQINVGMDVWGLRPVMFDEIVELAKKHGLL